MSFYYVINTIWSARDTSESKTKSLLLMELPVQEPQIKNSKEELWLALFEW